MSASASRRSPLHAGRCLAVVAAFLMGGAVAWTQDVSEPSLKAAFVYNIAKFAEWPREALPPNGTVQVCVAGDSPSGEALERVLRGRMLGGRPIEVSRVTDPEAARMCHLIYLSGLSRDQGRRFTMTLGMQPALTIMDIEGLTDGGAMVSLFAAAGKTRFDVDLGLARRARIRLSSKLLSLASAVRDAQ